MAIGGRVHQLARPRPDEGGPDHDPAVLVDHEPGLAPVVVGVQPGPGHVADGVVDHPDVEAGRPGLRLGQADGADLGVGEDDRGHGPVVGRGAVLAPRRRVEVALGPGGDAVAATRAWYLPWWVSRHGG